jgi:hypothetical protein
MDSRRVAIKFMSEELAQNPGCVARFAAERSSPRLKSPHVNILIRDHWPKACRTS